MLFKTKEALKTAWDVAWQKYVSSGISDTTIDVVLYAIYVNMFGIGGHVHNTWNYSTYRKLKRLDVGDDFKFVDGCEKESSHWDDLVIPNTIESLVEYFSESDIPYITQRWESRTILITSRGEMFFEYGTFYFIAPYETAPKDIVDRFVFTDDSAHTFEYLIRNSNGHYTTIDRRIKDTEVNIEENYNDDIPYAELCDFIDNNDRSGIAILRGAPGTGKSSLIRHFITKFPEREFVYLDPSAFDSIGDGPFIEELSDHENAVIILEDCEVLLKKRLESGDQKLAALLNLSDGILGDGFGLHFICTINTDMNKIDDAIQRKGRLRINYEFRPLSKEKTHALAEKLGKDIPEGIELTLGDIFHYDDVVEFGKKKQKKIGFDL